MLFALVVAVLAYATWWLGGWQFRRLDDRKAENAVVRTNEHREVAPVGEVLSPDRDPSESDEWRVVSATGTYDTDQTVVVRYRSRDGVQGLDVVVPLLTADGTALLVDRGWVATSNQGLTLPSQVPPPPTGRVTVTGSVRQNAGGSSAEVVNASTRSVSSAEIEPAIGVPTYGGFVQLLTESPRAATPLTKAEPPDLSNGPHFFYALQWWFFGILGLFGYGYLAWEEFTGRGAQRRAQQPAKRPGPGSGSECPHDPAVDGQHGATDEGRRRAEQERRGSAEL